MSFRIIDKGEVTREKKERGTEDGGVWGRGQRDFPSRLETQPVCRQRAVT